jgi:hypothetical protein
MEKNNQEVASNQQEAKENDGSQGDASPEGRTIFNVQGGQGQDVDGKKVAQHKHRLPKNSFFGPYTP